MRIAKKAFQITHAELPLADPDPVSLTARIKIYSSPIVRASIVHMHHGLKDLLQRTADEITQRSAAA